MHPDSHLVTILSLNTSASSQRYLKVEDGLICTAASYLWYWSIEAINRSTPCSLVVLTWGGVRGGDISSPWVPNHAALSDTFQLVTLPQTLWWWDSFTPQRPRWWAIKHRTGMKTSGPCNMETVLLHLTATVFDRGVKCVCVGFYVRVCGRCCVGVWGGGSGKKKEC